MDYYGIDRVLMIPEDGQPTVRPWDQMETDPTIFKLVSETPDLTLYPAALETSV
jgi:hypothetical protein